MSERNKDLTQGVLTRSKTVLRNSTTSPGSSPEEEVKVTHLVDAVNEVAGPGCSRPGTLAAPKLIALQEVVD